jgi:hypothetical protein
MAQSGSGSSRTPFDNDLVNDPHAPRDTQPLSAQNPTAPGAVQPPGSSPPVGTQINASRQLPPQVVTRGHNDDTTSHSVPTGNLTKRLPTSTLVGFALAGGAVVVLLLLDSRAQRFARPQKPDRLYTRRRTALSAACRDAAS